MALITAESLRRALDYSLVAEHISGFLKQSLSESGLRGYIIGVSGGVDSSTLYALAVRALGVERVVPVFAPDSSTTPREDYDDVAELVESTGGRLLVIELDPIVESYLRILEKTGARVEGLALGNLRARIRMTILYYLANKMGFMVAGSTDRTELLLGYFTKYGDGASDVAPLAILYKTQVRELAKSLGLPRRIAEKPSAPRLWIGQGTAEEELGLSFEVLDPLLFCLVDLGLSVEESARLTGVDVRIAERIAVMVEKTRHKREPPKTPRLDIVIEAVKRFSQLSLREEV